MIDILSSGTNTNCKQGGQNESDIQIKSFTEQNKPE